MSPEALPPPGYGGVETSPSWQARGLSIPRGTELSAPEKRMLRYVDGLTISLYTLKLKVTQSHKSL